VVRQASNMSMAGQRHESCSVTTSEQKQKKNSIGRIGPKWFTVNKPLGRASTDYSIGMYS